MRDDSKAMAEFAESTETGVPAKKERPLREVRFEYSQDFPRVLEHLRATLLVSTYQAGKLVVVGVHRGQLTFAFHNFERVMGVAADQRPV